MERLNTPEGVISIFCRGTASVLFVPPLPSVSTGWKDAPGVTWGRCGAVPFFCCASLYVPEQEALSA